MRYELTESEWNVIKPMLPNKPQGRGQATYASCLTSRLTPTPLPPQGPSRGEGISLSLATSEHARNVL